MGTQTDQLVGRAEEAGLLARALAELEPGRSIAILLVGEPGIGKTRLLTEIGARADAEGHLVLSGSASELERDLPFSLFVDALDEYVRGLDSELVAHLDDDVRTELGHVFPSLTTLAGGRPASVRSSTSAIAATVPCVPCSSSSHPRSRSCSCSTTCTGPTRPRSSCSERSCGGRPPRRSCSPSRAARCTCPSDCPRRSSAPTRAEQITRIELGALSPEEARELLGDLGDRVDPDVLYVESGGNPFYLEQLARSGGTAVYDEISLAGIGVPATVAAALAEELGLLSETQRLVLEGAAVAGDPFEPELAAAASDASEPTVMEALDALLKVDLLRTTDARGASASAIRSCAARSTRRRRPAGASARTSAAPRRLLPGGLPQPRAPTTSSALRARATPTPSPSSGRPVRKGWLAPGKRAHWFAEALRLQSAKAPAKERIELLFACARALTAVGRFDDSRNALLEALEIVPAGEDELRARLSRACAGVETNLGLQEQAHDRLARALEELPDQGSREAVALMLELMVNALWRTRHEEMHAAGERAVEAARRLGDIPMTAAALAELALANSLMGDPVRAEANHAEAAALVDSLPDDELAGHLEAGAWLAGVELYLDRYAEGELHANRALAVARATGQGELLLLQVATLGGLLRQRGKLAESAELLDGGIEAARLLGNSHALRWTLLGRSAAALRSGDTDLALATAQESVDLSQAAERSFHSAEGAAVPRRRPARVGRAGARSRAAPRVVRRRGADAHRREPESALPRGADARLARARSQCRGGTCRYHRAGLGLVRAAADGRRLGGTCLGSRRARRWRPRACSGASTRVRSFGRQSGSARRGCSLALARGPRARPSG